MSESEKKPLVILHGIAQTSKLDCGNGTKILHSDILSFRISWEYRIGQKVLMYHIL